MNGTEAAYAAQLELLRAAGEIAEYAFEAERLRVSYAAVPNAKNDGASAWYTPDFRVVLADGTIEMHEVKGHWEEAALVRIRVAADEHPYVFRVVRSVRQRGAYRFTSEQVQ